MGLDVFCAAESGTSISETGISVVTTGCLGAASVVRWFDPTYSNASERCSSI